MKKKIISTQDALEAMQQGKEMSELCDISTATIDFIYAFSALHYERGNYDEAEVGFRFLCRHKHRDADVWLSFARTLSALGKTSEASRAYFTTALLRPTAGLFLEIARAFFSQGQHAQAKIFIDGAKQILHLRPAPSMVRQVQALEQEVSNQ